MEDLDREQSSLTGNEKKIIIRVYPILFKYSTVPNATSNLLLRKEVASVLGIGEATVARVVAEYNGSENEEFSR